MHNVTNSLKDANTEYKVYKWWNHGKHTWAFFNNPGS